MKIALFGFGKMGKMVAKIAEARDHHIVHTLYEADVSIDFSKAEAVLDHVTQSCEASIPIVIGTTGWEEAMGKAKQMVQKSENAAFFAPNFSLGVFFFRKLLKQARLLFTEYEAAGLEVHHSGKKDAPSGTAKAITHDLQLNTSFASLRYGDVVGKHEVVFDSPFDTITLTHEAKNREGFACGAVQAAEWLLGKKGWFTLDDMLHSCHYTFQ